MSNVLTDANGKLASITLAEGAEAGDVVFDFAGATVAGGDRVVALTDGLPNPDVSDVLVLHAVSLSSGAGLELAFASDSDPAILAINGGCSANNTACTAETGAVQDVTPLAFPGGDAPFHILMQSDPAEVPEPGTLALLGVGLASLAAFGARSRRA
jgi:hypothetical protein